MEPSQWSQGRMLSVGGHGFDPWPNHTKELLELLHQASGIWWVRVMTGRLNVSRKIFLNLWILVFVVFWILHLFVLKVQASFFLVVNLYFHLFHILFILYFPFFTGDVVNMLCRKDVNIFCILWTYFVRVWFFWFKPKTCLKLMKHSESQGSFINIPSFQTSKRYVRLEFHAYPLAVVYVS